MITERFTLYDFIAAGMLAIFTVWLWQIIAFPIFGHQNSTLATILSYIFYSIGAIVITILAFRRKSRKRFLDGLLLGITMALAALFYIALLVGMNTRFFTIVLVSFTFGAGIGTAIVNKYMHLPLEEESALPDEDDETYF
jgi:membrane protease YdiL (CAAX protease family)